MTDTYTALVERIKANAGVSPTMTEAAEAITTLERQLAEARAEALEEAANVADEYSVGFGPRSDVSKDVAKSIRQLKDQSHD
jgi:hypothetical protein